MAEVSSVVNVTASLVASAVARREFSSVMYVFAGTEVAAATTVTKAELDIRAEQLGVKTWSTDNELQRSASGAFALQTAAEKSEPARAGAVYFQQDPLPKPLKTAGWFVNGAATHLLGSPIDSFTGIQALGSSAVLTIEGLSIPGTDFTSTSTGAAVATALQTAIRAISGDSTLDNVTVQFTGEDRLLISVPIADQDHLTQALGGTSAAVFGLDAESATLYSGRAPEATLGAALDRISDTDNGWYFLTLSPSIETAVVVTPDGSVRGAHQTAANAWVNTNARFLLLGNGEAGADILVANNTNHIWSTLRAGGGGAPRAAAMYSEDAEWKALAWGGVYSQVDFDAVDSLITGNLKELRGTTADPLSSTQIGVLRDKRINYYTPFGGMGGRTQEGWSLAATGTPSWIDAQFFIDWFVNAIQVAIFNLLTSTGRVPLTNRGLAQIRSVIIGVIAEARSNGGIAPLSVQNSTRDVIRARTGNSTFDGFLTDGALLWHEPISELEQQERENRTSPVFFIWAKLTGAVHSVEVQIVLEN